MGEALPNSPHAVSVALPRWKDIIDYEEKDPNCLKALKSIYPRFGFNPLISRLSKKALQVNEFPTGQCWPYPNLISAKKAQFYCEENSIGALDIFKMDELFFLYADELSISAAQAFWQHTGLGASSREAAIALNLEKAPSKIVSKLAKNKIKNTLANIYKCPSSMIKLVPSGMAALNLALESIKVLKKQSKFMQIGFPYVDVLKLPKVIFNGCDLILAEKKEILESEIKKKLPAGIIIELPSNPMLKCVDIKMVSQIARSNGIPLIIDDTIGSSLNIDTLHFADLIFTSLTKSFAGTGDVMAGSLVVSPFSKWKNELIEIVNQNHTTHLSDPDSIALEKGSRNLTHRIKRLNDSCLEIKNHFEKHPKVSKVLHPENCKNFNSILKKGGGFGCLFSFELEGGLSAAKKFYDNLKLNKGPSLGTNFTLVSPYVMLAHYKELEWAESCGVPPSLLRVSVGLENTQLLWKIFKEALDS